MDIGMECRDGYSKPNPYEIIVEGSGDYTVTLADTQGGISVKTFTLTDEVCCEDFELVNTDYLQNNIDTFLCIKEKNRLMNLLPGILRVNY